MSEIKTPSNYKKTMKNIAKTLCALTLTSSAVAQTSLVLIDDDFSTSAVTSGARFKDTDTNTGNWNVRSNGGPAWSISDGQLINPAAVTNDDKGAYLLNTVSSADTTLSQVTMTFDYTVGEGTTLYFHSHLFSGANTATGNVARTTAIGGATFAQDFVPGFPSGFNLKDGAAISGAANAALASFEGATSGTFSQTYDISGFNGGGFSIADVSGILAVFALDSAAVGEGAVSIKNLNMTAEFVQPLPSATWDGDTDANWATNTNWLTDLTPASREKLIFTGTANTATNNDLTAGTEFNGISFANTADTEGFSLSGNSLTLGGNITQSTATGSIIDTIALDLALNGDRVVQSGAGHHLEISGIISEDGSARGLAKGGAGALTLSAANTYTGVTSIIGGILTVTDDAALGSIVGNTTVVDNSALRLEGGLTIAEPLNIAGDGNTQNSGALQNSGLNTLTGAITTEGRVRFETDGTDTGTDTLTITGGVTGDDRISLIGDYVFNALPLVTADEVRIAGNGDSLATTSQKTVFNVAGNDWLSSLIFFGGTLQLGVADALPVDKEVQFGWLQWDSSKSVMDLNGFDQTVKAIKHADGSVGLGGDANITDSVGGAVLTVDTDGPLNNSPVDTEYQGRITGGLSLVKDGQGTLTLNNLSSATAPAVATDPSPGPVIPSSYTGDTTINEGTLALKTADLPDSSTVTISLDGSLQLDHNDVDSVTALILGGTSQAPGLYNAANSSGFISGTGSIFVGVYTPSFQILSFEVDLNEVDPSATITWKSISDESYSIDYSTDLETWEEVTDNQVADGAVSTYIHKFLPSFSHLVGAPQLYYRVRLN
ncbi:autotransporter-associated beta strand repeat-containing protein [bacterium]|nr:autotransporter-associated beta strand repeat-containing protein [bacterium]